MTYRSNSFDPITSWLVLACKEFMVLAGMEFMAWRSVDDSSGHPLRIVWRDPARPLQPDSMAEMLRYCAMAWRGGV